MMKLYSRKGEKAHVSVTQLISAWALMVSGLSASEVCPLFRHAAILMKI